MPRITAGVRLADLTTLHLGGPAPALVTVTDERELVQALQEAAGGRPPLILGGGSNLVVADAGVDATVVRIAIPGVRIDGDEVTIGAGEDWDTVVESLIGQGLCGLAPLSGIPGSTGATPVQNVGAYGTEVSDLLVGVRLLDRSSGQVRAVPADDLQLGYRTSALRGTERAVVTEVTFRLGREPRPVRYAELARSLGVDVGQAAPEAEIREAVLALRRSKGMVLDPADPDTRSVGSFFTNPILDPSDWAAVRQRITDRLGDVRVPAFPAAPGSADVKLSAAWLIEQAGFQRGHPGPGGRVAVSGKHTLALVNRGGSTADLLALAAEIRDGVGAAFGVRLQPEPVLVGVALP